MPSSVAEQLAVDEQIAHVWDQVVRPLAEGVGSHVGDGMRAHQVWKTGDSHQPRVGAGGVGEHRCDDGRCRDSLALKSNSVVQTARRAASSIPYAGDYEICIVVQVGQHLRMRR